MLKGRKFKLNLDEAAKRADEAKNKRGQSRFWKVPEGHTAIFRILPSGSDILDEKGLAGFLLHQYAINIEGKFQGFFTCGYRTYPDMYEECPIMEAIQSIGDFAPEKTVKSFMPKRKGIFNIYLRSIRDDSTGKEEQVNEVKILEGPLGLYDWIMNSIMKKEIGVFIDPYDGIDVVMSRGTKDQRTSRDYYTYMLPAGKHAKWGPILEDEQALDTMLDKVPNLYDIFKLNDEQLLKQKEVAAKIRAYGKNFVPEDEEDDSDDEDVFAASDPFDLPDLDEDDSSDSEESSDDDKDDSDFSFDLLGDDEEEEEKPKKTTSKRAKKS